MPSGLAGLIIVLGVGLVERVAGLGVGLMVPGLFRAFSKSSLCNMACGTSLAARAWRAICVTPAAI